MTRVIILTQMNRVKSRNSIFMLNFQLHFLSLLVPLLDRIRYDVKLNEDKLTECLRKKAVKWACLLDDVKCKRAATQELLIEIVKRTKCCRHSPGWRKWTYCEGVKTGDSLIWHNVTRAWNEERDDTLLQYLMCSEDYYIATQSFRTIKDQNIIQRARLKDNAIHFVFPCKICKSHNGAQRYIKR